MLDSAFPSSEIRNCLYVKRIILVNLAYDFFIKPTFTKKKYKIKLNEIFVEY